MFRSDEAEIIVRESAPERPWWLVTWLPHKQSHPSWPGFTITSELLSFPTDQGPLAAAEWVDRWAKERSDAATRDVTIQGVPAVVTFDAVPGEVHVQEAPAEEVVQEAERRRADQGWQTEITRTPDKRWAWRTKSQDGEVEIAAGIADTHDDAKLESVLDFPPPSGER
jgi:hypothetical protein